MLRHILWEKLDRRKVRIMDYNSEQEKKAHRFMIVFMLLVIVGFIGFTAWQNSKKEQKEEMATPSPTIEATVEPGA